LRVFSGRIAPQRPQPRQVSVQVAGVFHFASHAAREA
jgi:hypothetical protein